MHKPYTYLSCMNELPNYILFIKSHILTDLSFEQDTNNLLSPVKHKANIPPNKKKHQKNIIKIKNLQHQKYLGLLFFLKKFFQK